MKGKDKKVLHTKTQAELTSLLREKQSVLAKTRMEQLINKAKNIHAGTNLRREIAIIESILREREIANV